MENQEKLTKLYKQNLEENIVAYISEKQEITIEEAMDIFYTSELCHQITEGKFGIEYLDFKHLANDLMVNESDMFKKNYKNNTEKERK